MIFLKRKKQDYLWNEKLAWEGSNMDVYIYTHVDALIRNLVS